MSYKVNRSRLVSATVISLLFAAFLHLILPGSAVAVWTIVLSIFFVLLLYNWLAGWLDLVWRRAGKEPARADMLPPSALQSLNQRIHSMLSVGSLVELLDTCFSTTLPMREVRYFLSPDLLSREGKTTGFVAWGDAEPWLEARVWQTFNSVQGIQRRPAADPRLQEIFEHTDTDIAVPLVHRRLMLGVMLLGRDTDNPFPDDQEPELLALLSSQLPLVLHRIRIYSDVWQTKEMAHTERLQAMRMVSASIAHEMRTPLSGIRASLCGVENYLPLLLDTYREVRARDPSLPAIRPAHLENLRNTPARISLMIDQASGVIDLLLMNLRESEIASLESCHAAQSIRQAVERYPFRRAERERVHLHLGDDFDFAGVDILFTYVIFNLLKNALYAIHSAHKGDITLSLRRGETFNEVIVEDGGTGIPESVQARIFDSFFTTREEGTGAGLTFCKRTLQQFGGDIRCESEPGVYTRFTLALPVIQPGS